MNKKNNKYNWGDFLHILNIIVAFGIFIWGLNSFPNTGEGRMSALLGAFFIWIFFVFAIEA